MGRVSDKDISDDEIAIKIRELGDGNRPPSKQLFNQSSFPISTVDVEERFESWEDACRIAGFNPDETPIQQTDSSETKHPEEDHVEDEPVSDAVNTDVGPKSNGSKQKIDDEPHSEENDIETDEKTSQDKTTDKENTNSTQEENENVTQQQDQNQDQEQEQEQDQEQDQIIPNDVEVDMVVSKIEEISTNGTTPTLEEFINKVDWATKNKIYDKFDSWTDLLDKTSLDKRENPATMKEYTDKELLTQIENIAEGDIAPRTTDFDDADETAGLDTIYQRFDSWSNAIEQTDLKPRERGHPDSRLSDDELINKLDELLQDKDTISVEEYKSLDDAPPFSLLIRRFDKFSNVVEKLDIDPASTRRESKYTEDDIIDQINMLATNDTAPTSREFNDADDTASLTLVISKFDSWNKALEAAGFPPRRNKRQISKEEVKHQIQQLGGVESKPTADEFEQSDETCSLSTVTKHYETWNKAVEATGYEPDARGSK